VLRRRAPPGLNGEIAVDPVALDTCWSRLVGVVNERAAALMRTSFTSIGREAGDLSAGVFGRRGSMVAPAVTGTAGPSTGGRRTIRRPGGPSAPTTSWRSASPVAAATTLRRRATPPSARETSARALSADD
jgi:hypothetical protein